MNIGLIRDREGIYAGLLESQSTNGQLAICFLAEGKLIVKISVVRMISDKNGKKMIMIGTADDPPHQTEVSLDDIRSIYPIREFHV